jgi:NodT family efflux transporter outer membrane factor (OMF) lipoprotein
MKWRLLSCLLFLELLGCSVAEPYVKPELNVPKQWTDSKLWRPAQPKDDSPKVDWWKSFKDEELDALEDKALEKSSSLKIAIERVNQARMSLQGSSAGLLPQFFGSGRLARQEISNQRPLTNYNAPNWATVQTDIYPALNASYEIDFWGRVSSTVNAAKSGLEQSFADFENVKLILSADVANNYFNLRQADLEIENLEQLENLELKAIELASARYELGLTPLLEKNQQSLALQNTRIQLEQLKKVRGQFEHSLSTLLGENATDFHLERKIRTRLIPDLPLEMPSELLERRPDVASAERNMMAANAQIGVAKAAYFPTITLNSQFGYESGRLSNLYNADSRVWSFGPNFYLPIFDGGRIAANIAFTRSSYVVAVETYKKIVLTAFQEVEDGILGVKTLENALQEAKNASVSAKSILQLAKDRYTSGASSSLDWTISQENYLSTIRQESQITAQRISAQIFLIKAFGGGWAGLSKTDQFSKAENESSISNESIH